MSVSRECAHRVRSHRVCVCILSDRQLTFSRGLFKAHQLDLLLRRNSLVVGHVILENKR